MYCVAFSGDRYLMVYNPRRRGWEMPGGHTEPGETAEAAAEREFLEEAGYEVEIAAVTDIGYCDVCAGWLGDRVAEAEMTSDLFSELPEDLSFETDEYEWVIEWAQGVLRSLRPSGVRCNGPQAPE
ncbi:MAG: NUDIX domain-containing protein [Candidatus Methanomethylophilaceae archaeon]|nr:NUDIX domain-containing protein [Candidatus Methanomethylophilaceae archaeon]